MPNKSTSKVKPNVHCPCKSGRKYKKCCGSHAGDLVYFVADPKVERALENEKGQVLIFRDRATAAAAALHMGCKEGEAEIIPLTPIRFAKFAESIPHVFVTVRDYDVSAEEKLKAEPPVEPTPLPPIPEIQVPERKMVFL